MTRLWLSALLSGVLAWRVHIQYESENGSCNHFSKRQNYLPYSFSDLPIVLIAAGILLSLLIGWEDTTQFLLSLCFSLFWQITIFYLILFPCLPYLRENISARVCAMLWLIPNYLEFTCYALMAVPSPIWVITIPGDLIWGLLGVWFAGFLCVMLWKLTDHFVFRHSVLRDSAPVTDPYTLQAMNRIIAEARMRHSPFELVVSPRVSSPLSVGLLRMTTKIVLPQRSYSQEELELILRHEIIHIGRRDSMSKFYMVFCTAMCWFNPLMWLAMGKCAEDLELSCDETVLVKRDEATRKRYALLLLDAAGNQRGFTTCLSASGRAMRYRLRSITEPITRSSGALVLGIIFFLVSITSGFVALAYDEDTGANHIYQPNDFTDFTYQSAFEIVDPVAFHEYISGLTMYEITGNYSFSGSTKSYIYPIHTSQGSLMLILYDRFIQVTPIYGESRFSKTFYVPEGIDWEYLQPITADPPTLTVSLLNGSDGTELEKEAILRKLWRIEDNGKTLLCESDATHGRSVPAYRSYTATFHTTYGFAGPTTVHVEKFDGNESYTVTHTEPGKVFSMELPKYRAEYTVYTTLKDKNGVLYEAEFWFKIGT